MSRGAKKKAKRRGSKPKRPRDFGGTVSPADALDVLLRDRYHGAANIRGIRFQLRYSMARAVELAVAARAGGANAKSTLHFEGLEDVDVEKGPSLRGLTTATVNGREFVQVKTASKPWGLRTFDHDQEVVCVAGETVPSAFEFLVQRVERDVGHQGRQRPALRHPLKRRLAGAVRQDHPAVR